MLNAIWTVVLSTVALASPLILAAMGGFTSERSGIINIALEGKMLTAACAGYLGTLAFHNPYAALLCAIAAAIAMSLLHWLLTQHYNLDHIISGMAINLLAAGGTNYFNARFSDPDANSLPVIADKAYWLAAFMLPFLLFIYARYTKGGLRLFAVGSDPDKSRLMGVQPMRVRLFSLVATGVFTGIAGGLIFTSAGQFTEGMTAGRGYIALAALIIGGWRPLPGLVACIAFGFFQALQLQLQGTKIAGANIPSEIFSSLPYVITVIALAGLLGRTRAPAGLGKT